MDFIETVKGFILSPTEAFRKVRDADLGDTFKYYLILLVINTVLSVIVSLVAISSAFAAISQLFPSLGLEGQVGAEFTVIVFAILWIFVTLVILVLGAAWTHLFVYLFGGRKGYLQTLKAFAYGQTPALLIGWIPLIGIIGAIWSIVLWIIGVRELHEISTGKAAAAVIVAGVIIIVLIALVAAALLIAAVQVVPMPVGPQTVIP